MGKVGSLKLKSTSATKSQVSKPHKSSDSSRSPNSSKSNDLLTHKILLNQKTPAQLAFDAAQLKKQQEKLPILASKSHKEKVAEFNDYLGKLSEHHDIPKVGPG